MEPKPTPTIRELYPQFSEQELAEAEDTLGRYLELVLRTFERLELEAGPPAGPLSHGPDVIQCPSPGSASSPGNPPQA